MDMTEIRVKRLLATALLPLLLLPGFAQAEDKTHSFTDIFEKQRSEPWWGTMAECAGRVKSLSGHTARLKRGDPKALEERVSMFWIIAVARVRRDRAIADEAAAQVALERAQQGNRLQEQANLVYTASSKMEWEYDRQIGFCEKQLNAYAAAFPEDFKQRQ